MRKRSLLLHVMLRHGMAWYALDNTEYLFRGMRNLIADGK